MIEPGDISLDEAADHALTRMGLTYDEQQDRMVYDCENGHFECAIRPGGHCFNAAIAESAGIIARERNGGDL
jgi:hypothetical protein